MPKTDCWAEEPFQVEGRRARRASEPISHRHAGEHHRMRDDRRPLPRLPAAFGWLFLFTSSCVTSQQHPAILKPVLAEGISAVEAPKSHGVGTHE